jgi:hypothetical protein
LSGLRRDHDPQRGMLQVHELRRSERLLISPAESRRELKQAGTVNRRPVFYFAENQGLEQRKAESARRHFFSK